jgi:hypothetical protein
LSSGLAHGLALSDLFKGALLPVLLVGDANLLEGRVLVLEMGGLGDFLEGEGLGLGLGLGAHYRLGILLLLVNLLLVLVAILDGYRLVVAELLGLGLRDFGLSRRLHLSQVTVYLMLVLRCCHRLVLDRVVELLLLLKLRLRLELGLGMRLLRLRLRLLLQLVMMMCGPPGRRLHVVLLDLERYLLGGKAFNDYGGLGTVEERGLRK